jgi:hypothetical protein
MIKRTKFTILGSIVISLLFILAISTRLTQNILPNRINVASGESPLYSGDYEGDISIMYLYDSSFSSFWNYENSSTHIISYNYTDFYNNEYKLESLNIRMDNLENISATGNYKIAEDISNQVNLTDAFAFAQEFTAPELLSIDEIMIYVNFYLLRECYYDIYIYDENLLEEIYWGFTSENRAFIDEWISVSLNTPILEPGEKYNIVLKIWFQEGGYNETFNYWKAEEYIDPSFDKGITRFFDGESWSPIPFDNRRDMLCNFSYTEFIHPSEIDLKCIFNNQTIVPNYQEDGAFITYHLEEPPNQNMNVTVISNQTIPKLNIEIRKYYTFIVKATGNYSVDENQVEWTIKYPFEDISLFWPPPVFFLFERDWSFVKFQDPNNLEMDEVYFGSKQLYNESYFGITVIFTSLEKGIYIGTFNSPNYCNSIISKIKTGSDYISKPTIQLGQTIKLEAEIVNTLNEPISGGFGQMSLKSPSGQMIYNETEITLNNGTLSSSDIDIESDFQPGQYETTIFWTNGKEVAIYTAKILVESPVNIIFWVLLSVGIMLVSISSALVARKYIKQRNWEKSLKNLFTMTKEGINLYEYSFGIEIQDPALISGMISALTSFVRSATGSKKSLRTVDQEDKKLILYHGIHTTTALMSDKDLPVIHKRVKKFSESFENKYSLNLKNWRGETSTFKDADVLIKKYFPIDVEEQIIHGVRGKLIEFRKRLEQIDQPSDIVGMIREISDFMTKYRAIINLYYIDYYFEIIRIAEEKISLS